MARKTNIGEYVVVGITAAVSMTAIAALGGALIGLFVRVFRAVAW